MMMFAKQWLFLVLLSAALLPAQRSLAAVDMFLKLVDSNGQLIEGESVDQQHPKEILIASFSHGVTVPTVVGGGGTGRASFSGLDLTKTLDKASPLLYSYTAQGRHIQQAVLSVRFSGATPFEFYRITLTDVIISSVQTSGAGERPTESLSLNFTRIEWRYVPQNANGSAGTPVVTTWNIAANTP
jgi:type VI secretion system secreted protein Hcp